MNRIFTPLVAAVLMGLLLVGPRDEVLVAAVVVTAVAIICTATNSRRTSVAGGPTWRSILKPPTSGLDIPGVPGLAGPSGSHMYRNADESHRRLTQSSGSFYAANQGCGFGALGVQGGGSLIGKNGLWLTHAV